MKSLGKCAYCTETVSEIGAYAKLSANKYAHLKCYTQNVRKDAYEDGRRSVLAEQEIQVIEKQQLAETQAKIAYENARRCAKCGIAMMAERPAALPAVYVVRTPFSSDARQCADCGRVEIGARAGARRTAAPASAAEAIRTATTRPADAPQEKKPEGPAPDRFSLLDLDD